MRVLIVGGGGFVGAYVARELLQRGHDEVLVFDTTGPTSLLDVLLSPEDRARVRCDHGDITDRRALRALLERRRVDRVVDLVSTLPVNPTERGATVRLLCEGFCNLLDACHEVGVDQLVWGSSMAVFGEPGEYDADVLPGDAPPRPKTVQGASETFREHLGAIYERIGLRNVGLRLCVVYGPGHFLQQAPEASFVSQLVEWPALRSDWFTVPFGDESVNWLYVKDAARAVALALEARATGVHAVCGDYRPVRDVAAFVKKLVPGANIRLQPGLHAHCWKHDMRPAMEAFGYWPQYAIEDGVRENIEFLRENGAALLRDAIDRHEPWRVG